MSRAPASLTTPLTLRGAAAPVPETELLHALQAVRAAETALMEAGLRGELEGPAHVSLGQEAVAVGTATCLRADDQLLSTHRGHGHALAMGLDPRRVLAEILGHRDGYGGGVGGSMHLIAEQHGFLGTNGLVGAGAGLSIGAALSAQHRGDDTVVVCMLGDGALGAGIVYESMNMAALWRLPLVFVCENNQYAEMTPTRVHLSTPAHERAAAFGLGSYAVDGDDVAAVRDGVDKAVVQARDGQPGFLECATHRWTGHYVGDPQTYRPDGEAETWRNQHCPVRRLARRLGVDPQPEQDRLDEQARALVRELLEGGTR